MCSSQSPGQLAILIAEVLLHITQYLPAHAQALLTLPHNSFARRVMLSCWLPEVEFHDTEQKMQFLCGPGNGKSAQKKLRTCSHCLAFHPELTFDRAQRLQVSASSKICDVVRRRYTSHTLHEWPGWKSNRFSPKILKAKEGAMKIDQATLHPNPARNSPLKVPDHGIHMHVIVKMLNVPDPLGDSFGFEVVDL